MSFLFLFVLWVMWNGKVTLEIVAIGVFICAALYLFINRFMGYSLETEQRAVRCFRKAFRYFLFLVVEIIKANLDMVKMIFAFDMEPEPILVKFRTGLCTETGRVILANSITLTPGTLTVDLCDGEILVHCLDRSFSEGMEHSEFLEKICRLETAAVKGGEKYGS